MHSSLTLPRVVAGVLAGAALTAAFTGCGGGDKSSAATNASRPRPGMGFTQLTATQRACLKKQGVTLPSGGPPSGAGSGQPPTPPNGQPGNGQSPPYGQPPSGQAPPSGQGPPGGNAGQFQKMQKAFKACGVSFPSGPGGRPPASGTSGTGAQS